MKRLLLLPALLLCSCATVVKYDNGVELARSNTDFESMDVESKTAHQSLSVHIRGHQPGKTIRASGSVVGTSEAGLVALLMAWLSHGVVR